MIAGHRVLAPRTGSLSSPRLPPAPGHCPRAGQPRARRRGLLPNSGLAGGAGHGWAAALGSRAHRTDCASAQTGMSLARPELPATAQAGPWPRHVTACLEGHAGPRLRSRGDLALHRKLLRLLGTQRAADPGRHPMPKTGMPTCCGTTAAGACWYVCGPAVHRVRGESAPLICVTGTGPAAPDPQPKTARGQGPSRPQATTCASDNATGWRPDPRVFAGRVR